MTSGVGVGKNVGHPVHPVMRYGHEKACFVCGQSGAHHEVHSDEPLRVLAEKLADLLLDIRNEPANQEFDRSKRFVYSQGRMLGLMRTPDDQIIACLSGGTSVDQRFHYIGESLNVVTIAHDWSTVPKRSIGNHDLDVLLEKRPGKNELTRYFRDRHNLSTKQPAGGPGTKGRDGCWCAAPKLISYVTQIDLAHYTAANLARMAMIEIWCGKASASRKHKQAASSCPKCQAILPTLLCRNPKVDVAA